MYFRHVLPFCTLIGISLDVSNNNYWNDKEDFISSTEL